MSTRSRTVVAAVVLAGLVAAPSASAAFDFGVAAGEVTATTAKVWTRADRAGAVTVLIGTRASRLRRAGRATARASHDDAVTIDLRRLKPDRRYFYRFVQGSRRSEVGRFRTAPRPSARRTIRFALVGRRGRPAGDGRRPAVLEPFEVYARMARERNAFNVNLGDTIYSDSEVGATATASSSGAPPRSRWPTSGRSTGRTSR